jgi:acyl carrier protein
MRLVAEKMHRELPSIDTELLDSGLIDSLALVDLLMHIETEFGVRIALDNLELDKFRSIATIAELIAEQRKVV